VIDDQDQEITLGTGKLLSIFLGLAALCAIFFGLGFMVGKGSSAPQDPNASLINSNVPSPVPATSTGKPGATQGAPASKSDCPSGQNCGQTPEMSFYQADETTEPVSQPSPAPTASVPSQNPAPEAARQSAVGGYVVQVAAVSKQQDAEALVNALKKKSYAVFIATNTPSDNLFHVQIGPFAEVKEAEAVRSRLQSDGYNPILKR